VMVKHVRHLVRIIFIHLTAEGLDINFFHCLDELERNDCHNGWW
jgi:hypothetical protein